ncbi:MAG: MBL fold metallo-hydrolase [Planctomycetota bacterium]|jgi:glyoxylase-like metal-dependent hydrolase (beta-lactamase superfamily II)
MKQIQNNIYLYEDCCNVYIVKDDNRAVLFDIGSGAVLENLNEIGVEEVEAVFITGPYRNRAAGVDKLSCDTKVFWPEGVEDYIDKFCRIDPIYPVIHKLFPGIYELIRYAEREYNSIGVYSFAGMRISSMPVTESMCGMSYLLDMEGTLLCFTGDCIYEDGRFYNCWQMEHMHHTGTGQRRAADALHAIHLARPDYICPAHGAVMEDFSEIQNILTRSREKLLELSELYFNSCLDTPPAKRLPVLEEKSGFSQLSKHLYFMGNNYVLLSETGAALLYDFNCSEEEILEEWLKCFRQRFGEDCKIEKVLISHRHYDHWSGLNELREDYDFEVVCNENMAADLEDPKARKRPFTYFPGLKVDCALRDGEKFSWHEYDFTSYYFPAQTDMHSGYEVVIDGKKCFLSGDNFYPPQQWGGTGGLSSFNGGDPERLWTKSIDIMLESKPDYVICGHAHPYEYRDEEFQNRKKWAAATVEKMKELAYCAPYELAFNQHVFEVYPFTQEVEGDFSITLSFMNYDKASHTIKVKPVVPEGVTAESTDYDELTAEGGKKAELDLKFNLSGDLVEDRMITFDMYYDDRYLGERLEAFIY